MNLFQKQQNTSGYTSIPDASAADDETAVVSRGTPQSTTTRTMDRRSPKWIMVATSVLGMKMMLMVTGGSVWMLQTTDGGLTTTAMECNRDNGVHCCKKMSSADCKKRYRPDKSQYRNDLDKFCIPINGYGGVCHKGAGTDPDCCTDKDQGTFHFHIIPGQSSCT